MLNISYKQHISNEDILVGKSTAHENDKERKCEYFGYILRGGKIQLLMLIV